MATYAVRGTYSDGEVRHEHVHVADAKACLVYLGQKTEGLPSLHAPSRREV